MTDAQKVYNFPTVTVFGKANLTVTIGRYRGMPAVFVAPAKPPGVMGELAPPVTDDDKNRLVDGEWVMTFPTETQAFLVADALTGRKIKNLDGSRPDENEIVKAG